MELFWEKVICWCQRAEENGGDGDSHHECAAFIFCVMLSCQYRLKEGCFQHFAQSMPQRTKAVEAKLGPIHFAALLQKFRQQQILQLCKEALKRNVKVAAKGHNIKRCYATTISVTENSWFGIVSCFESWLQTNWDVSGGCCDLEVWDIVKNCDEQKPILGEVEQISRSYTNHFQIALPDLKSSWRVTSLVLTVFQFNFKLNYDQTAFLNNSVKKSRYL